MNPRNILGTLMLALAGLVAAVFVTLPADATIQYSTGARNARATALNTTLSSAPVLNLYSGTKPANCAASAPSGQLAQLTLPSSAFAAPSSGVMSLAGTWTGTASAAGTCASFRFYESTNTTCIVQGTVTASGGGGDLTFDNAVFASGQTLNISSFAITEGNAFRFVRPLAPVGMR